VQPARAEGPGSSAAVQRLPDARPPGLGRVPRGGRANESSDVGAVQRVRGRQRRPAAAGSRVHPRVGAPQPVRVSRSRRLPAVASPGSHLASAGILRPSDRGPVGGPGDARRRGGAGVRLPRIARLRRRQADGTAGGRPRRNASPVRGVDGTASRRVRARGQHVGRGPGTADERDPPLRPRHHARRQQHDDRGVPLRQADDRPAVVLGSVRQRPAGPGARPRRPALHLRVRGRRAEGCGRPAGRRLRPPLASGGAGEVDPIGRGNDARRRPHRGGGTPRSPGETREPTQNTRRYRRTAIGAATATIPTIQARACST
jgi:hypothetical protein